MPPDATPLQLAEKLLVLTHALGDAADRGAHGEMQALFSERSKLLKILETADTSQAVLAVLRKVQVAETEALTRFQKGKATAVHDLEKGLHGRKVQGTYAARSGLRAFDVNG